MQMLASNTSGILGMEDSRVAKSSPLMYYNDNHARLGNNIPRHQVLHSASSPQEDLMTSQMSLSSGVIWKSRHVLTNSNSSRSNSKWLTTGTSGGSPPIQLAHHYTSMSSPSAWIAAPAAGSPLVVLGAGSSPAFPASSSASPVFAGSSSGVGTRIVGTTTGSTSSTTGHHPLLKISASSSPPTSSPSGYPRLAGSSVPTKVVHPSTEDHSPQGDVPDGHLDDVPHEDIPHDEMDPLEAEFLKLHQQQQLLLQGSDRSVAEEQEEVVQRGCYEQNEESREVVRENPHKGPPQEEERRSKRPLSLEEQAYAYAVKSAPNHYAATTTRTTQVRNDEINYIDVENPGDEDEDSEPTTSLVEPSVKKWSTPTETARPPIQKPAKAPSPEERIDLGERDTQPGFATSTSNSSSITGTTSAGQPPSVVHQETVPRTSLRTPSLVSRSRVVVSSTIVPASSNAFAPISTGWVSPASIAANNTTPIYSTSTNVNPVYTTSYHVVQQQPQQQALSTCSSGMPMPASATTTYFSSNAAMIKTPVLRTKNPATNIFRPPQRDGPAALTGSVQSLPRQIRYAPVRTPMFAQRQAATPNFERSEAPLSVTHPTSSAAATASSTSQHLPGTVPIIGVSSSSSTAPMGTLPVTVPFSCTSTASSNFPTTTAASSLPFATPLSSPPGERKLTPVVSRRPGAYTLASASNRAPSFGRPQGSP
ncbi:unnamed protein product [Amoebophrya sp. A25]|nr:unnamed protein product [Amoebophrya sp. A25]|eukprot:GSA25T00008064001.1